MINKKIMMESVYSQLAIDYNCSPDDFLKDGFIFTEASENKDRRPFPWVTPRIEIVTSGRSVVINASRDILPYIREQLEGKTRYEALCMPFVYGISPYFLSDIGKISPMINPDGFEYEIVERSSIKKLYDIAGFRNALQYDENHPRPDVLVTLARSNCEIVGIAGASADCKTMWQIGVDVLPPYRGKGLAVSLVNMLTLEILRRGYIPYYGTDGSNVVSQQVAVRAGYIPAWAHCYKTRLDGVLIPPVC
ncbi:GNAT family N-acetyltransferase [Paenibacillus aestuarii]|uniref:GNAT family N-acetyltransferase n=1 Tax=Paenibacillus aestuarii TaxID=516965 RepID=A0ABW0KH89_9BACL|nr:GNAT family N-acetyltransferase [Paenibacillus aestuarii]